MVTGEDEVVVDVTKLTENKKVRMSLTKKWMRIWRILATQWVPIYSLSHPCCWLLLFLGCKRFKNGYRLIFIILAQCCYFAFDKENRPFVISFHAHLRWPWAPLSSTGETIWSGQSCSVYQHFMSANWWMISWELCIGNSRYKFAANLIFGEASQRFDTIYILDFTLFYYLKLSSIEQKVGV